jgi:energy-coupling factor transporter ATP-binding protein EcfA2/energy-coupling factor transporter transmembrane protein EcfT
LAEVAVKVSDLWFWYAEGFPVLRGVSLGIKSGQTTVIVGANGSGKTTLVKHFNGLLRPAKGSVLVLGQETVQQTVGELARSVGFLFQHPEQQIFSPSVRQEVAFGPRNLGLTPSEVEASVEAALVRFDLAGVAAKPPAILSYGLRRRATLASLAAMDPPVVVLDEPTVGLDVAGLGETMDWLSELKALGRTVVLVTHDMALAGELADRIVVLERGQIIADAPPAELFRQPRLLERGALTPPPLVSVAQALGLGGDASTVQSFCDAYVEMFEVQPETGRAPANGSFSGDASEQMVVPASPTAAPRVSGVLPQGQRVGESADAPRVSTVDPGMFLPADSWLHRMDPRAKLWAVLLAGIVGLLFRQVAVLVALLAASHMILLSARVPWERLRWLWSRLAPLLIMILILQPFFSPGSGTVLFQLGPLRLTTSGLLDGLSFALRAAALAFVAAVLFLTTDPDQLVRGLVKLGLPYPWGLTVGLSLRYLPTTYGLFVTVSEAQQARGWIVGEGGVVRRLRSYVPILVATIIAALRLGDMLGLALAARGLGFPARRTVLHDIEFTTTDWVAAALVTIAFGAMLYLRLRLGYGAQPW